MIMAMATDTRANTGARVGRGPELHDALLRCDVDVLVATRVAHGEPHDAESPRLQQQARVALGEGNEQGPGPGAGSG